MTLYEVLGLKSSATNAQVKAGYRRMCGLYHPDRVKGMENKFQEVYRAYQVLVDPDRRSRYDRTGRHDDVKITPLVIQSMVEQTVLAIINAERPDGSTDDPTWENIRQKVVITIQTGRREVVANLKRDKKKLDRLDNVAKRFRSRTEADPIGDAFAAQRRRIVEDIHRLEDGLELSLKTEEVFASYDYVMGEVEPKPEGHFSPDSTRRLRGPVSP